MEGQSVKRKGWMENAVDFFWDKNPLISWLSTVPKLSKILLFAGGLGLALGALHFAKHENAVLAKSALILFFTVGYLVWCVLIEAFFPKSLQGKVSAIVLVFILFAMVFNLVDSPFQYQNQVLIWSKVNPDGVQTAEAYRTQSHEDGTFSVAVYIKNTEPNTRGRYEYVSYQVCNNTVKALNMEWKNNRVLLVNGEEIRAGYHYRE